MAKLTKTRRRSKAPAVAAYHPTKGYRRISERRLTAQALMVQMPGMMMALANTAR